MSESGNEPGQGRGVKIVLHQHGHSSFHSDETGTISFPYLTLALRGDDAEDPEYDYDDLEEETINFTKTFNSDFENSNTSDTKESLNSHIKSQRGKGKNSFIWQSCKD